MRHTASSIIKALLEVLGNKVPFPGKPLPDRYLTGFLQWRLSGGDTLYDGPVPHCSHALAPLLSRVSGRGSILPVQASALWLRASNSLEPALNRISASDLSIWAWKGLDNARSIYASPSDRPMFDIDILVEARDVVGLLDIFLTEGWVPGPGQNPEFLRSGILSEYKLFIPGVMLEVHTHPFYYPSTLPGRLPDDLFAVGRELQPGLMALRWEYALLLALLHHCQQSSTRQSWWLDEYLLSEKVTECGGWELFEKVAALSGLDFEIRTILAVVRELPGSTVPEELSLPIEGTSANRIAGMFRAGRGMPTLSALITLEARRKLSYLRMLVGLARSSHGEEEYQ